jgi:hypothetical protein
MVARTSELAVAIVILGVAVTLISQVNYHINLGALSAHIAAIASFRRAHAMLEGSVSLRHFHGLTSVLRDRSCLF